MAEPLKTIRVMAGKYDDQSEAVVAATDAQAALVIVINGNKGNGCSASVTPSFFDEFHAKLPTFLRQFADNIERDCQKTKGN